MKYKILLLLFTFWVVEISITWSQVDLELPKLLPANTQSFSPQTDFSRLCFSNIYLDDNGRLWLNTCNVEKTLHSLHLVQFDGYKFLPADLDKLNIPTGSFISILGLEKEQIYGYYYGMEEEAFFAYNLYSTEFEIIPYRDFLPPSGIIRTAIKKNENEWIFYVKSGDELIVLQKNKDKWTERLRIPYPFLNKNINAHTPRSVVRVGDEYWYSDHLATIVRWNEKTGDWKKYTEKDFDFDLKVQSEYQIKWWFLPQAKLLEYQGDIYLCASAYEGAPFFKYDSVTDQFIPINGLPANWTTVSFFKDHSENMVFTFLDEEGVYRAILQDEKGMQFDFSAFMNPTFKTHIIKGENFKKQLYLGTQHGLFSVSVQQPNIINQYLKKHDIRAMTELPNGNYLISTSNNGVKVVDNQNKKIVSIESEKWKKLFDVGGFKRKLLMLDGRRIFSYDQQGFFAYDIDKDEVELFPAARVHNFTFLNEDTIAYWDESRNKLSLYDFKKKKDIPFFIDGKPFSLKSYHHNMLTGRDGQLLIVTSNGLWKIDCQNQFAQQYGFDDGFRDSRFLSIYENDDGKLWLGTYIGGLHIFDPKTGEVKIVDQELGLTNNTIVSILKDQDDVFWIATYNGISLVSEEGEVIANIKDSEGVLGHEFNRYASYMGTDGSMLLGTTEGLNIIAPTALKSQLQGDREVSIYISELSYYNGATKIETRVRRPEDFENRFELSADRRYLKLDFALSSYMETDKNKFAYCIVLNNKNTEQNWQYIGNQHQLNLTNLPAGKYEIWIKGSDYRGNWTEEPAKIKVYAKEFFYKQPWFYTLVAGVIALIAFLWIRRLRLEKIRLEAEVNKRTQQIRADKEVIAQQAEELMQLDEIKSRFFTNISHELRTPLTLINTPIEKIIKQKASLLSNDIQNSLKNVLKNGRNLLRLVEELLDLSRLEANKIQLNELPTPLAQYTKQIFSAFDSSAHGKKIDYSFETNIPEEEYYLIDRPRVEKILNNLLSNALKFTPKEGKVNFEVDKIEGELIFKVADSGRGIPTEDVPFVFDRYFQTSRTDIVKGGGAGIGLALSKELATLMEGKLKVESSWGEGSIFSLYLPAKATKGVTSIIEKQMIEAPIEEEVAVINQQQNKAANILMVEDNIDMQNLIVSLLSENYHFHIANDGEEAWNWIINGKIKVEEIDLILSDIMMPNMDGYELLEKIKQLKEWQQIPIVMLTARADQENKLQALRLGVDDYILKPFSPEELQVRLANLIQNYHSKKEYFREASNNVEVQFESTTSADQQWLQKIETLAKDALEKRTDLTVLFLAEELAMSERNLRRKVKLLTGLSAKQYIQEVKLQKARHLLENKTFNTVAEISYACGFNTPGYFSQVYEKHYGKKPTEYLSNIE
ncbi:MAG: response regulator [Bacteroidota bacterium]